jgi:hypothetical protein
MGNAERNRGYKPANAKYAMSASSSSLRRRAVAAILLHRLRVKEVVVAGSELGLAEVIEALRAELMAAIDAGKAEPLQFKLDPVEVTVQTVVTKEANGKIGWKVLEFGGKGSAADTQTLSLRLTPVWRKSDGTLVSDFTISSAGEAGDRFGPDR